MAMNRRGEKETFRLWEPTKWKSNTITQNCLHLF